MISTSQASSLSIDQESASPNIPRDSVDKGKDTSALHEEGVSPISDAEVKKKKRKRKKDHPKKETLQERIEPNPQAATTDACTQESTTKQRRHGAEQDAPKEVTGAPASQAPATAALTGVEDIRARITAIYQQHNPDKLSEVDKLMEKYVANPRQLYEKICQKYSVAVDPAVAKGRKQILQQILQQKRSAAEKGAPTSQAPATTAPTGVEDIRARIVAIYKQHNPDKLSQVDKLMEKCAAHPRELYEKICQKYNVHADPAAGAANGYGHVAERSDASVPLADAESGSVKKRRRKKDKKDKNEEPLDKVNRLGGLYAAAIASQGTQQSLSSPSSIPQGASMKESSDGEHVAATEVAPEGSDVISRNPLSEFAEESAVEDAIMHATADSLGLVEDASAAREGALGELVSDITGAGSMHQAVELGDVGRPDMSTQDATFLETANEEVDAPIFSGMDAAQVDTNTVSSETHPADKHSTEPADGAQTLEGAGPTYRLVDMSGVIDIDETDNEGEPSTDEDIATIDESDDEQGISLEEGAALLDALTEASASAPLVEVLRPAAEEKKQQDSLAAVTEPLVPVVEGNASMFDDSDNDAQAPGEALADEQADLGNASMFDDFDGNASGDESPVTPDDGRENLNISDPPHVGQHALLTHDVQHQAVLTAGLIALGHVASESFSKAVSPGGPTPQIAGSFFPLGPIAMLPPPPPPPLPFAPLLHGPAMPGASAYLPLVPPPPRGAPPVPIFQAGAGVPESQNGSPNSSRALQRMQSSPHEEIPLDIMSDGEAEEAEAFQALAVDPQAGVTEDPEELAAEEPEDVVETRDPKDPSDSGPSSSPSKAERLEEAEDLLGILESLLPPPDDEAG